MSIVLLLFVVPAPRRTFCENSRCQRGKAKERLPTRTARIKPARTASSNRTEISVPPPHVPWSSSQQLKRGCCCCLLPLAERMMDRCLSPDAAWEAVPLISSMISPASLLLVDGNAGICQNSERPAPAARCWASFFLRALSHQSFTLITHWMLYLSPLPLLIASRANLVASCLLLLVLLLLVVSVPAVARVVFYIERSTRIPPCKRFSSTRQWRGRVVAIPLSLVLCLRFVPPPPT